MRIYNNELWGSRKNSLVSIITAYYNRANVIDRALNSVRNQSFRDFEYIIVDDGSIESSDDKIISYMNDVDFPCLFIKKQNGGVHTARNTGITLSRGKYIIFIDSDDELVPDSLERFVKVWTEVETSKLGYFEVKMRCKNQNGIEEGQRFPDGINDLPYAQALRIYEKIKGEHIGMRLGKVLRENLWPEPKGVKFVTEDILWCKLRKKYKSYFSNQIARVYYTDTEDSLDRAKNNNEQSFINILWNITYMLNDWRIYKTKYGKNYFR